MVCDAACQRDIFNSLDGEGRYVLPIYDVATLDDFLELLPVVGSLVGLLAANRDMQRGLCSVVERCRGDGVRRSCPYGDIGLLVEGTVANGGYTGRYGY